MCAILGFVKQYAGMTAVNTVSLPPIRFKSRLENDIGKGKVRM